MKKLVIKIFNLIFLGATAFSLAMFATKDFFSLDMTYAITKDFVVDNLDGEFGDNVKKEDLEEAFKDGVNLDIHVGITADSLLNSFSDKSAVSGSLKDSIKRTAEDAVDKLHDPLNTVVERVSKNMAKDQAQQSIKDQISHFNQGSSSTDELYDKYVTEDDVNKLTDNVYDALTGDGATVDKVVDAMANDINDILGKMSSEPGFESAKFETDSEQGEKVKEDLTKALDEFGLIDSEGNINDPETAMAVIINTMLNSGDNKTDGSQQQNNDNPTKLIIKNAISPKEFATEYTVEVGRKIEFTVEYEYAVPAPEVTVNETGVATVITKTTEPSPIQSFEITGVSAGDTTFIISCDGDNLPVATIHVIPLEKAINFKSEVIKVDIDKTKKLEVERNEAVDPTAEVTYSLSNVNPEGVITLEGDTLRSTGEGTATITATCDGVTISAQVKSEKIKTLKESLTEFVDGYIEDAGIYDIVDQFGGYIVYGLIALMVPWALFAIFTIIRTLRRGKCWTKPWIIFTFAFIPVAFAVIQLATTMFSSQIIDLVSNIPGASQYAEMIGNMGLTISTSSFYAGLVYLAFIPLTIVYMIICHKYKKEYKDDKKAKKLAKKHAA